MGEIVKPDGSKASPVTAEERLRPLFKWLQSEPHPSAFQRIIVNALIGIVQMVGNLTRQYVEHRHNDDGTVMLPANVLEQAARVVQADNEAEEAGESVPTVMDADKVRTVVASATDPGGEVVSAYYLVQMGEPLATGEVPHASSVVPS